MPDEPTAAADLAEGTPMPVARVDGFIAAAIAQQLPIETMERLFALYQQQQADDARRQFFEALTRFQSIVPPIVKDRDVGYEAKTGGSVGYRYASLTHIVTTIKEPLAACGLSFRFEQRDIEGGIEVTCIATHVAGHSESTSMSGPADTSGKKNAIQSRGSSNNYLKRYTLGGVFGLVIDEDDDGRASDQAPRRTRKAKPSAPPPPLHDADTWLRDEPTGAGERSAADLAVKAERQPFGRCTAIQPRPWKKQKDDKAATGWLEFAGLTGRVYTSSLPEKHGFGVGDDLAGIVFKAATSASGNPYASAHSVRKAEEEANDLTGEASPSGDTPAGSPSASAPPAEGRVHKPKAAGPDVDPDGLCVRAVQLSEQVRTKVSPKEETALREAHLNGDLSLYRASDPELAAYIGGALDLLAEQEGGS